MEKKVGLHLSLKWGDNRKNKTKDNLLHCSDQWSDGINCDVAINFEWLWDKKISLFATTKLK